MVGGAGGVLIKRGYGYGYDQIDFPRAKSPGPKHGTEAATCGRPRALIFSRWFMTIDSDRQAPGSATARSLLNLSEAVWSA